MFIYELDAVNYSAAWIIISDFKDTLTPGESEPDDEPPTPEISAANEKIVMSHQQNIHERWSDVDQQGGGNDVGVYSAAGYMQQPQAGSKGGPTLCVCVLCVQECV